MKHQKFKECFLCHFHFKTWFHLFSSIFPNMKIITHPLSGYNINFAKNPLFPCETTKTSADGRGFYMIRFRS